MLYNMFSKFKLAEIRKVANLVGAKTLTPAQLAFLEERLNNLLRMILDKADRPALEQAYDNAYRELPRAAKRQLDHYGFRNVLDSTVELKNEAAILAPCALHGLHLLLQHVPETVEIPDEAQDIWQYIVTLCEWYGSL